MPVVRWKSDGLDVDDDEDDEVVVESDEEDEGS